MSKLVVLSIDSLFDEDMEYIRTLPAFKQLFARGSYSSDGMRSIYPTLTYPAHASIITGTTPDRHGVFHNEKLDPGNPSPEWCWYHNALKTETFLDAAKRAGFSTASVGWPCMGACKNVDYLVPEIWPKTLEEDPHPIFATADSQDEVTRRIIDRHLHKLRRTTQPFMDHVMIGCACDLLREVKPDIMFIHLAHLDHTRHAHGLHAPATIQALIANDEWLSRFIEATQEAGTYDETNFIVVSDHGHLPVKRMFQPNILLAQAGLIETNEEGKLVSWKAFCNSASLSAQVYLKDEKYRAKLEEALYRMRSNPEYGVESVFTKEECLREHNLDGDFDYVIEGTRDTAFGNNVSGDLFITPDNSDYKFSVASHGHLPYKGPQPVFIAAGPNIRQGIVFSRKRIIDEAPTYAAMFGVDLPQATGSPIKEILA